MPENAKLLQIIINGGLVTITILTLYGSFLLVSDFMSKQTVATTGLQTVIVTLTAAINSNTRQNERVEQVLRDK